MPSFFYIKILGQSCIILFPYNSIIIEKRIFFNLILTMQERSINFMATTVKTTFQFKRGKASKW
jgi:hypothetical protein